MSQNPYEPHAFASDVELICVRRIDIIAITVIFTLIAVLSFVLLAIPAANEWVMPRFGWVGGLVLFPLNFLFMYLWKPAPRLLTLASGMLLFTAIINAAIIAYKGTVSVVTNAFNDRLQSSYAWSVLPLLLVGLYVATVAWQTRNQERSEHRA